MRLRRLVFIAALSTSSLTAAPFKEEVLPPEELKQLDRDKIMLRHRSYRQVFTPYIFSPMPVFITSDSLLHAFHVVLEESVAQMEERFSAQLAPAEYDKACRFSDALREKLAPFAGVLAQLDWWGSGGPGSFHPNEFLQEMRHIAVGQRHDAIRQAIGGRYRRTLRDRWLRLLDICHRLESLAHKHLRGVEPTKEEASFIVAYGSLLGGVMFYDGNSYHRPRDDAPRAASVFNHPGGQCLIAAVGRPQEIRVLYPWKGKEIHCRGAILPFHTFRSDTRLIDKEWMKKLDSDTKPGLESWLRPILTPAPPDEKEAE